MNQAVLRALAWMRAQVLVMLRVALLGPLARLLGPPQALVVVQQVLALKAARRAACWALARRKRLRRRRRRKARMARFRRSFTSRTRTARRT